MNPLDVAEFDRARDGRSPADRRRLFGGGARSVDRSRWWPCRRPSHTSACGRPSSRASRRSARIGSRRPPTRSRSCPVRRGISSARSSRTRRAGRSNCSMSSSRSTPWTSACDWIGWLGEVRPGTRLPVLLQVNVDDDPAKAGFEVGELAAAIDALATCGGLELRGFMTIGRLVANAEAARPTFRHLREVAARPASRPATRSARSCRWG